MAVWMLVMAPQLLTGLQNGDTYTISIVTLATTSSQLLPSDTVIVMNIHLGTYIEHNTRMCTVRIVLLSSVLISIVMLNGNIKLALGHKLFFV